jgi:hypothetical protein
VFLFVEGARKAHVDIASHRGAMDRGAFDVHSSLSSIKKEAGNVASSLSQTEIQLSLSSNKIPRIDNKQPVATSSLAPSSFVADKKGRASTTTETRASVVLSRSSTVTVDASVGTAEAVKKALACIILLDSVVERRETSKYKDQEKEYALILSLVIRHVKAVNRQDAEG